MQKPAVFPWEMVLSCVTPLVITTLLLEQWFLTLGTCAPKGYETLNLGVCDMVASKVCITNPFHMFVFMLDGGTRKLSEMSRGTGTEKG